MPDHEAMAREIVYGYIGHTRSSSCREWLIADIAAALEAAETRGAIREMIHRESNDA